MKNNYEITEKYVNIYLNKGKNHPELVTPIDIDDFNKINIIDVSWYANWDEDTQSYRVEATQYTGIKNGKPSYKRLSLPREIMECPKNKRVDHIDHNTLNNRRINLRIATDSNNLKNRKSKNSNNTSGYRNVTWMSGHWRIQLQINGKNTLFPNKFDNVNDAGKFAKEMREKYYGNYSGN